MQKKLQKVGGSRGVVIPAHVIDLMKWDEDTFIEITVIQDTILLKAAPAPTKKSKLFARINREKSKA